MRPVKVLMLFYGDKDSPAIPLFQSGLRARMEQELQAPVWIYEESFDEGWLGQSVSYDRTMEKYLREKYANRGIDVVVPLGDYPLQYMQKRRKTLLPDAKLVYVCWRSPQPSIPDSTGLIFIWNLAPTLEVALAQNPGTRHVLLITGATAVDRGLVQPFLSSGSKYLQEMHHEVDLKILPPATFAETRSALAALSQDTITVFISYYEDSVGQGFVPGRILPAFAAATNRPMYGWVDSYIGRGIVGGSLVNLEASGAAFGNLVLRVLRGEKPGTIPEVRADLRENRFDWKEMKRWGIGMDRVPAGSTVINREYTVWELYKWEIAGALVLIAIGVLLIGILIRLTLAQRRHLKQLAYQREVGMLVAQFAAALINLPAERVQTELELSFQQLLEFFDLDRISLFELSADGTHLRLLCARTSTGVERTPAVIDLHQLSWPASQILKGAPIIASNLGQLPDEADPLKEALRKSGILSFAAFPLQHHGKTFATLSFSTVRNERVWNDDLVQVLRTIADIFGSALEGKHAEEGMRATQNELAGIVDSAMDAIIAIDSQQRIVVFNATAEKIFGCRGEEALGRPVEHFIPERFRGRHGAHVSGFAQTGVTNRKMGTLGALWALRANGDEFPIEASISQVERGGNKLFTVIIRDITERERADQALRESEGRFRLVANTAPVLVWMSGPDKLCTYFNQTWLDFTGRRLEDQLGSGWAEGVHPDDRETCMEAYTRAFDRRQTFMIEYRLRAHDGNFRWLLDKGVPRFNQDGSFAGYIGSCVDLTERKQAEEAVNQSEQMKASILKSLRNHLAVLDSKGTIVAATARGSEFTAITGNSLLDLRVGANYFDICRAAVEAGDRDVSAALAGVREVSDRTRDYFELEYDCKTGTDLRWFQMSVTPLKTTNGGVVISLQDITERKRHEQAIQELSGRLINAQEQERSRIARELHDDINQQLAILAIELQQLEGSFPDDLADARQKIQALWKKTHLLSTDVQRLSHELHSSKLQHLGITAALRSMCHEFSEQHRIPAEFQFREVPPEIDSYTSLALFRVAQESLHNVAKHSHAKKVRMELIGTGEKVVLHVSDNGVGFDPSAPGNQDGLGMVSMNERIRLVGGTLSVCSRPSLGTQIEATVPLSSSTRAVNRSSQGVSGKRRTG